jgi:opacity protein-like surface antigen
MVYNFIKEDCMKKFLILFLFIISLNAVNAQNSFVENFYIGISGGPSFPMNDFGSDNVNNPASGYAVLGSKFEINVGIRFLNLFDLSFMSFVNTNGTDLDKLVNYTNSQNPGYGFTADSKSWTIYGGLGGFGISYPVQGGFIVDARVLGGILSVDSPRILLKSSNPNTFFEIEGKTTTSFVYLASAGARYPISDGIHLGMGIEYLGAGPKFDDVATKLVLDGNETISTTDIDQLMDVFNVTLGFKFYLFQMFR